MNKHARSALAAIAVVGVIAWGAVVQEPAPDRGEPVRLGDSSAMNSAPNTSAHHVRPRDSSALDPTPPTDAETAAALQRQRVRLEDARDRVARHRRHVERLGAPAATLAALDDHRARLDRQIDRLEP